MKEEPRVYVAESRHAVGRIPQTPPWEIHRGGRLNEHSLQGDA
jgi:hypothetical protein